MPRDAAARGTLFVVGTPIGHLDDLSARAAEVLASCDLIACEDTRRSRVLLDRRGLRVPLISCHKFNEAARLPRILATLAEGRRVALISDGGTPGLSDPGARLVRAAREAGHAVVPVPGPSAVTALLSVSGFETGPFTFAGFLPHRRGERRRFLQGLAAEPRPILFFESPRRLVEALRDAVDTLGDRDAVLGREMTKKHEEIVAAPLSQLLATFETGPVLGEIAFLVAGAKSGAPATTAAGARTPGAAAGEPPSRRVRRLVAEGMDRKEAMRLVARETGLSRRAIYRSLLDHRDEEEE